MLNVYRSNRMERLVEALCEVVGEPLADPAAPEWIAVQSQGMRAWLGQQLADRFGVVANVRMPFPRGLIQQLLSGALGDEGRVSSGFDRESLTWSIMAELPALLAGPGFEPLQSYLADDPQRVKRYQLAARIAGVFDEYALYRPEMVLDWERSRPAGWQPQLWNAVCSRHSAADHVARVFARFRERAAAAAIDPGGLPQRISLFGISSLPPMHVQVLAGLPEQIEVDLFLLSPSREYWAHIGRRVPRGSPLDPDEVDLHLDQGHPLLGSLGLLGRDFQAVLESAADYREPVDDLYEDPASFAPPTLLTYLQSDILALRHRRADADAADERPAVLRDDDRSVSIHSCHGPMREVEVLRDQLLALFDDEQLDLRPHQVLVLTPDLETYAAPIEAVFGETIPFGVVGRSVRRQAAVVDGFCALLALVRSRVGRQEVLDLLAAEPVRARFGLSVDDVERAQAWADESGVRWGIDREHRRRQGQPGFVENTWRFGLDRLLLGYALPDDEQAFFDGVVPFAEIEGEATAALGGFVDFCAELFEQLALLDGALRPPQWVERLTAALERLFDDGGDRSEEHRQVRRVLAEFADAAERAGFDEPVDLEVVRVVLDAAFDLSEARRIRPSGAVTVSDMLPLRGIPARVICLLGMNDRTFPRSGHPPGFDLMAERPRVGDRSLRNDDRYLFLEALLAARERLLITYVGQDIQSNRTLPPSVLVSELLDSVADGFCPRERLLLRHPLQPFSRRYFERSPSRDPRLFSYSGDYLPGIEAIDAGQTTAIRFFDEDEPLSLEGEELDRLRIDELSRFFAMPCEYLLRRRLGIYLEQAGRDRVEDREPFSLGDLERYVVGTDLLEGSLAGRDLTKYYLVERGRGRLPLGVAGRRTYDEVAAMAGPIAAEVGAARAAGALEPLAVDVALPTEFGHTRLTGTLDGITRSARVQHSFGTKQPKRLLDVWIRHLALNCLAGADLPRRSIWIGRKGAGATLAVFEPLAEGAHRLLARLVELYWLGQQRPLEFFPATSRAYSYKMYRSREDPDQAEVERQAIVNAGRAWRTVRLPGGREIPGDVDNPAVARFFGERLPFEERGGPLGFRALARLVYDPLLAGLELPTQAM